MKPVLPPHTRTLDMVEDGRVVVRHVFYGRDEAEAKHMEDAHREADKSMDASMRGKPYKGTDIKAVRPFKNGAAKESDPVLAFEQAYSRPSAPKGERGRDLARLDREQDDDR
jgi:hypothetical protein